MDQRLEAACHSGDLAMLHNLLREDKLLLHRLSITTASIDSPLHIAASLDHTEFSEELITRKPDLALELNSRGLSALHLASAHGHLSIVKQLISKVGSHLCLLKDKDGRLPVHTAAMKGRISILEELINACPESARALTYRKESVLHLAVQFNSSETLEYLVEKLGVGVGGEINDIQLLNLKDDKGNTILHHAVARRQLKTVKLLLSKEGMEVNAMNLKGLTALDVLLESPSEHGDLMLGEVIRAANGKVTGEVLNHQPSIQTNTTPITPTDYESSTSHTRRWVPSLFRRRARPTSKKKVKVEDNYTPGQLMVVATLIATITFQSGLNPPGGLITQLEHGSGDNTSISDSTLPGAAILRSDLGGFLLLDMIGLFSSLSIILILICVVPRRKKKMMKILVVIMWVSVFSTALAFCNGIYKILPDHSNRKQLFFLVLGLLWIFRIFMLWVCFRFSVYLLRKVRLWPKKQGDEERNAVRRGGCLLCCKRIGAVMLILVLLLILGYFNFAAFVAWDLNWNEFKLIK
ncbi:hypothetical protein J5N97_028413 [Dioscorea zingiberensis]|uniref:PGG domain-containing protein n=1 Tax=Dioscorea zingiberensis TaxID=325984 RepID=A0A9D5BYI5_9LILI|nr:hypothetical protein J5N97_028413 [Dioscorea zingiberensis]